MGLQTTLLVISMGVACFDWWFVKENFKLAFLFLKMWSKNCSKELCYSWWSTSQGVSTKASKSVLRITESREFEIVSIHRIDGISVLWVFCWLVSLFPLGLVTWGVCCICDRYCSPPLNSLCSSDWPSNCGDHLYEVPQVPVWPLWATTFDFYADSHLICSQSQTLSPWLPEHLPHPALSREPPVLLFSLQWWKVLINP